MLPFLVDVPSHSFSKLPAVKDDRIFQHQIDRNVVS